MSPCHQGSEHLGLSTPQLAKWKDVAILHPRAQFMKMWESLPQLPGEPHIDIPATTKWLTGVEYLPPSLNSYFLLSQNSYLMFDQVYRRGVYLHLFMTPNEFAESKFFHI
jgi:hypothetical protein